MLIYNSYHIIKGFGFSDESKINAFDSALKQAGISEANLVPVSSIIPVNCQRSGEKPIYNIGEIVFCVIARHDGLQGETISAGLAHVDVENEEGNNFGLVVELHGNYDETELNNNLKKMIVEMSVIRSVKIKDITITTECIKSVETKCASVVVLSVFR